MAAVDIDRADIQGDILEAYGNRYSHTSYLFITIGDPTSGRAWLSDQLRKVTTALRWTGRRPRSTFNLAVTSSGLSALGVSAATIESFSAEFQQGMQASAGDLGDVGASAPDHWEGVSGPARRTCSSPSMRSMTACSRRRSTSYAAVWRSHGQLEVVHARGMRACSLVPANISGLPTASRSRPSRA